MHILETLHLSAANNILASRAISSSSLLSQNSSLMSSVHGFASAGSMARNVITILFLFTKSDIKTAIIPVTVFAALSQPNASPARLAASVCWTWTNLLQGCVSNQSLHPAEDLQNKPWRPISSKRITVEHARILRWLLLPLVLIQSYALGVPWEGLSLSVAYLVYNEFKLDDHWFFKNLCNAWGYASFNAGAAGILSDPGHSLGAPTQLAIVANALIILTTIHAQDFFDESGDRLEGRHTAPIVWPEASRMTILVMIPAWSYGLLSISSINHLYASAFFGLGALISLRFYFQRSVDSDRASYAYYNAWLTIAQVIHTPVVMRLLS